MGLYDQALEDLGGKAPDPRKSLHDQAQADLKSESIAQPQQAKTSTPWDTVSRQAGLGVRAAVTGLTSLPALVGDVLNATANAGIRGVNSLAGSHIPQFGMVSTEVQNLMNKAGIPQPQTGPERFVQSIGSAITGVGPNVALGNAISKFGGPIASAIGDGLSKHVGMQMVGAAGAGAGGQAAGEMGAGLLGQLGGALAGGAAGVLAPSAGLAAVRGTQNAASGVKAITQPFTNPEAYVGSRLAQTVGPEAQALAEKLKNFPTYVEGSQPTSAQAAPHQTLIATEKSFANNNGDFKNQLAAREAQNNAARWQAIHGVAQTPDALDSAIAQRAQAAAPLYDAAHAETTNVGKGFVDFARRPAVTQAMQEADKLARNEGVSIKWPTPEDRSIDGKALDYTSRALSDMIDRAKRAGSNQEVRALTDAKDYLQGWTERYIPGVKEASQVYAKHSVPVNTMEAAQQLSETLGKRALATSGDPQITHQAYQTGLARALKSQKYGIDPAAETTLQNVGKDLQRATASNALKSPGSDTAYNLAAGGWLAKQIYGPEFEGPTGVAKTGAALGSFLAGPHVGTSATTALLMGGGSKIGQAAADRLNQALAKLLLEPRSLAPYFEKQAISPQQREALAQALRRNVNFGTIGAAQGAHVSRP